MSDIATIVLRMRYRKCARFAQPFVSLPAFDKAENENKRVPFIDLVVEEYYLKIKIVRSKLPNKSSH